MEILVTGANGFLGKTIVDVLKADNAIYSLSRSTGDYKISLDDEIPFFERSFDLVIHAAGKAHLVPKNEVQKKEFYNVNVIGTKNLLKGLEKYTLPKQFVFISSVAVYGKNEGKNILESTALAAKDAYGLSKITAEELVLEWCQKNHVVGTILRLPLLVGENPPGNLGAMIRAIKKGYYFDIAGGKAKKSMVLVNDIAHIIVKASLVGGTYNLTDGHHPSFKDLSYNIAVNQNKRVPFNMPYLLAKVLGKIGDIVGDRFPVNTEKITKITSDLTFDDLKAKKEFGWKPQSILEYVKNNKM